MPSPTQQLYEDLRLTPIVPILQYAFVSNVPRPGADNSRVDFAGWQECPNGALFQMVYLPHVCLKPAESVPTCPDCGAPFKKTREYPGLVGFEASCTDEHDTEPLGHRHTNSPQSVSQVPKSQLENR
jgi:hypothetical protein